jgi:type VI secretion system secreted protein VgrG
MIIKVETVIGEDVFILDSFIGTEHISNPFLFKLEMRSSDVSINPSEIINTEVLIKILSSDTPSRFFSGIVSSFSQVGIDQQFSYYTAEIVPRFWLLKLNQSRAIYQNVSALDIIINILESFGVVVENRLTASYRLREYCVQYDESYFDFLSRLFESEGIFYFFDFDQSGHKMILADDASSHKDCEKGEKLFYRAQKPSREMSNTVSQFESTSILVTQEVVFSDYNYQTPSSALISNSSGQIGSGSCYEYPGYYNDLNSGEQISRVRLQQKQMNSKKNNGESLCPVLQAGGAFTLEGFSNLSSNVRYVLKSITHQAKNDSYINSFEAFPDSHLYRPLRKTHKPFVSGSQSAIVVGPPGEEIWTDSLGRIKVKFYWDRSSVKNENSSCWIRVSQTWADTGWGSLFIPRIGQEVIISYIDGDPDRPIVTGCVYNAERDRPVELPANQTQSVIRTKPFAKPPEGDSSASQFISDLASMVNENSTNSTEVTESSTSLIDTIMGDDRSSRGIGNEIRFEDKTNEEEFYQHAHKDMKVDVENDLTTTVYSGDENHIVEKGNRSVEISKGNETHLVEGVREVTVNGDENHCNKSNFTHSVKGNYECKVEGDYSLEVDGDLKIKVKGKIIVESDDAISLKTKKTFDAQSALAFSIKSDYSISMDAALAMEMKSLSLDIKNSVSTAITAGASMNYKAGGVIALAAPAVQLGA